MHRPFSPRQLQVAELLSQGKSNPDIAAALGLARGTIDAHIMSLYNKVGVHNRTEFAVWWLKHPVEESA